MDLQITNDFNKQKEFFKEIIDLGKFKVQEYYNGSSTTEIINKIKNS